MSPGPCSSFIAYPWSSFFRKNTAGSSMLLRHLVFFLLLVQNPCYGAIQPEYSILDRGLGTSFSTASGISAAGARQMPMQVCITIGCCRHVCRQFTGPASSDSSPSAAENCKPAELEPVVEQPPASEQVAVIPEFLEWNDPQVIFSPSIKYLTIVNTGNDTMLEVNLPKSTNGQFYGQGSEETTVIAPKGSVRVPVVYLPQHLGEATAKFIIRTSAGDRVVQVRGQGVQAPYRLQDGEGIEVLEGDSGVRRLTISFFNPDKQDIQIDEVESWPEDSHRNAFCFTDRHGTQGRVTNCTNARKREAVSGITVAPRQRVKIFEAEISKQGTWKGSLYVKFNRKSLDEVMILPLELQASKAEARVKQVIDPVGTLSELQVGVRPGTGVENSALNVQDMAPGKLTQADNTLKPLMKDLGIILLRQAELKPGSLLSTSQNRPTLMSEKVLSFSTVQVKSTSQLWVNLVNPSDQPVTVKLEVAPEVKSTSCKYKASWFRQAQQEAKVEKNNGLFGFQEGALIQAVIQPEGKLSVGPVAFHPKARCDWSGLLFVKNSLSGLEWMPLHGRARSAEVSFLDKAQGDRVKKLSLVAPFMSTDTCPSRISSNFSMKNTGDLALRVHQLHLDGSNGRLKLESPGSGFILPAGQTTDLMISYEPNLEAAAAAEARATLELVTSIGKVRVPVGATLPKQLVAACRESPLHERLILPLSVSALAVVLGVFSHLLLQELHQPSDSKPRPSIKAVSEDRKQRQNNWRKALNLWKSRRPYFQLPQQDKSPLKVKIEPDVDRLKLKKKKKARTPGSTPDSSAPVSPMSSSASGSPFSASDSERKTPTIDRILDASRLSRSKTMPNATRKQDHQGTNTNTVPDGHDQRQETSSWNQFPAAAKPKGGPWDQFPAPAKLEDDPWNQLSTPTKPEGGDWNQSSKPEELSAREPPANSNKISTVEQPAGASDLQASGSRTSKPYTPPLSPIARAPGSPVVVNNSEDAGVTPGPLTSIGQLRRRAAELCNQHLSEQPPPDGGQVYDIWGDHFAQISSPQQQQRRRRQQPSYSAYPSAIINSSGSLFSQSLPTWSPDVPPPPSIPLPSPEDLAKAFMPIPSSSSSSSNTSYLFPATSPTPEIETYPGLPEPTFDQFSESIYRAVLS